MEEVEGALAGGLITPEQMVEANRHAEAMAEMKMQEFKTSLTEINQSLRAEIISEDKFDCETNNEFFVRFGLYVFITGLLVISRF